MEELLRICKNCEDFDSNTNTCEIRFLIQKDKTKIPLPRKPKQSGCKVFMYKIKNKP